MSIVVESSIKNTLSANYPNSFNTDDSAQLSDIHKKNINISIWERKLNTKIIEAGKSILDKKRTNHVNQVDEKTFLEYEKVLNARDGLAVVSLSGYSCGGCGATIPMQKVTEIRAKIRSHRCDVCARFLYSEKISNN